MNYRGFVAAWLAGEAIVVWRIVHKDHRIPVPGALLGISALFAGLALTADIFPAWGKPLTLAAWGLDLAVLLQVIGSKPDVKTHWPPPLVTNPAVLIPGGHVAKTIPKSQV